MDNLEKEFLDCASKFDAAIEGLGKYTKLADCIVRRQDENACVVIMKKLIEIIRNHDAYSETAVNLTGLMRDSLYRYVGYSKIKEAYGKSSPPEDKYADKPLDYILKELDNLVGLESVKQCVNNLIAYQSVQQMRKNIGLEFTPKTLHLAFTGNPGTGKTTVARIIGHIYKKIGLLSKGHFTEVSRTDLIAGYQGQTALKVKKVIDNARGGVLFIDEAYSITENESSDSYGRECLTELTKALEDYREDLVVIVAGYTQPMKKFFESNPGLRSRFNSFIEFPDYTAEELLLILKHMCSSNSYVISEDLAKYLEEYFAKAVESKDGYFANARLARNLFEDITMEQAKRLYAKSSVAKEELSQLLLEDVASL